MRKNILAGILAIFLAFAVCVHANPNDWQGQYYIGTTFQQGTYTFNFTVWDDPVAGSMCWSAEDSLSTGTWGQWYFNATNFSDYCNDTSEDYYVDISIDSVDQGDRKILTVPEYLRTDGSNSMTGQLRSTSSFLSVLTGSSTMGLFSGNGVYLYQLGQPYPRMFIDKDSIQMGSGTSFPSSFDTNIYRADSNLLKTDDDFEARTVDIQSTSSSAIALNISLPASQSADIFNIEESDGSECLALRGSNQLIFDVNGDCSLTSSTGNFIRMYAPDGGFTGNYLLFESNTGTDKFKVDYDGSAILGSSKLSAGSGTFLMTNTAGGGMTLGFNNGVSGVNFVSITADPFDSLDFVSGASKDITMFESASSGETPSLQISGYRTGDALRTLDISVGSGSYSDSAYYSGVTYHRFSGQLRSDSVIMGTNLYSQSTIPTLFLTDSTSGHDDWKLDANADELHIEQYVGDSTWTERLNFMSNGDLEIPPGGKLLNRSVTSVWLYPQDALLSSNPATLDYIDNTYVDYYVLNFTDGVRNDANWNFAIPESYNGEDFTIKVYYVLGSTTDADIQEALVFRAVSDNGVIEGTMSGYTSDTLPYGGATYSTGDLFVREYSGSAYHPDAGDMFFTAYRRFGNQASDTVNENVRLIGIKFEFPGDI